MSTFINIQVNVDNDAFNDRLTDELCNVVDIPSIVGHVSDAGIGNSIKLHDSNGNTCGKAWMTDGSEFTDGEIVAAWGQLKREIQKLSATIRRLGE